MSRNGKKGVEDWKVAVALLLVLLIIVYLLTACASQQNVSKIKYSSGCLIEVEAASSEVADHIAGSVNFKDCGTTTDINDDENN